MNELIDTHLGDSSRLVFPLTWEDAPFSPTADWFLLSTFKRRIADPDSEALVQKFSPDGGLSVTGSTATVQLVYQDTNLLLHGVYWVDIRAFNSNPASPDYGAVRTVSAPQQIRFDFVITREGQTSVPVYTTNPPFPATGPEGPPGNGVWGTIQGNLPDQIDLQAVLDTKGDIAGQVWTGTQDFRNGVSFTNPITGFSNVIYPSTGTGTNWDVQLPDGAGVLALTGNPDGSISVGSMRGTVAEFTSALIDGVFAFASEANYFSAAQTFAVSNLFYGMQNFQNGINIPTGYSAYMGAATYHERFWSLQSPNYFDATLYTDNLTAARVAQFPDGSGTFALTTSPTGAISLVSNTTGTLTVARGGTGTTTSANIWSITLGALGSSTNPIFTTVTANTGLVLGTTGDATSRLFSVKNSAITWSVGISASGPDFQITNGPGFTGTGIKITSGGDFYVGSVSGSGVVAGGSSVKIANYLYAKAGVFDTGVVLGASNASGAIDTIKGNTSLHLDPGGGNTLDLSLSSTTTWKDFIPQSNNGIDLGTSALRWRTIYGTDISATGLFTHSGTVTLTNPALWRIAVDANRANPFPNNVATIALDSTNTMSIGVVESSFATAVSLQLANLSSLKNGDCWEVCQVGAGVLTVSATTAAAQALTLQYPPGGGPRSAGQYSTLFLRIRSSGVILVTGGVP